MHNDVMRWWMDLERKLRVEGFEGYVETSSRVAQMTGRPAPPCLTAGCSGQVEYRGFIRGNEHMGFLVCPTCGGVWNPTTHERFH